MDSHMAYLWTAKRKDGNPIYGMPKLACHSLVYIFFTSMGRVLILPSCRVVGPLGEYNFNSQKALKRTVSSHLIKDKRFIAYDSWIKNMQ
jgi:hypothetical protein